MNKKGFHFHNSKVLQSGKFSLHVSALCSGLFTLLTWEGKLSAMLMWHKNIEKISDANCC